MSSESTRAAGLCGGTSTRLTRAAETRHVARPGRGRPSRMNGARRAELADLARAGLTLAEMATALGVSRQRIHQMLQRCPLIALQRRTERVKRWRSERTERLQSQGFQWIEEHRVAGAALGRFLREAGARGWEVTVRPQSRPLVNGVPLAFHTPRRTVGTTPKSGGEYTRYYPVQLVRPDWLNVVALPTGRYLFYLPDPTRQAGKQYIPVVEAGAPSVWPATPPDVKHPVPARAVPDTEDRIETRRRHAA